MTKRVLLAVSDATAMGRGVIGGVAAYGHEREDWSFETLTPVALDLGRDASSRSFDAVIGAVTPRLAAGWEGEARRFVVNVSRARVVPGATNVFVDDAAIGRMAAAYLEGKALPGFAYFGPSNSGARAEAFVEALARPQQPVPRFDSDGAAEGSLPRWLGDLPSPCGVLAFNDVDAVALIRQHGRRGTTCRATWRWWGWTTMCSSACFRRCR